MNDLILAITANVLVFVIAVMLIDLLLAGFVHTFLRVKGSRGKKLLIQVRSPTRDYFKVGFIEEGMLVFTYRKELFKDAEQKRLGIDSSNIFRCLGVMWVQVDEETNNVGKHDFSVSKGFDAVKWDNLLKRALYRPSVLDQREKIILILLILVLVAVCGLGFMVYQMNAKLGSLVGVINTV